MGAKAIHADSIEYRVFLNNERDGYRGYWFCPHPTCCGAFRSEGVSETKEEAIEFATEAAQRHEEEIHAKDLNFEAEMGFQPERRGLELED